VSFSRPLYVLDGHTQFLLLISSFALQSFTLFAIFTLLGSIFSSLTFRSLSTNLPPSGPSHYTYPQNLSHTTERCCLSYLSALYLYPGPAGFEQITIPFNKHRLISSCQRVDSQHTYRRYLDHSTILPPHFADVLTTINEKWKETVCPKTLFFISQRLHAP
jgi:hypothetical protein